MQNHLLAAIGALDQLPDSQSAAETQARATVALAHATIALVELLQALTVASHITELALVVRDGTPR